MRGLPLLFCVLVGIACRSGETPPSSPEAGTIADHPADETSPPGDDTSPAATMLPRCALGSSTATPCANEGARCTTGDCGATVCTCKRGSYECEHAADGLVCGDPYYCEFEGHPDCVTPPASGRCTCEHGRWSCLSSCPPGCPSGGLQAHTGESCSLP